MKSRLYSQCVRASAIALLAGLAATVSLAVAPSTAHAQFGFGAISGTVNGQGGPLEGATVTAFPAGGGPEAGHTTSHADGTYTIVPLPVGNYKVRFDAPSYVTEFYDDAPDFASGDPVTVTAFATTPGIDATLTPEATISGTVTDEGAQALGGICVSASPQGGGIPAPDPVTTDLTGTYTIPTLLAGSYAIAFDPCDSPHNVLGEWYDDKPSELLADPITVTAGEDQTGVDAELATGGSISGTVLDSDAQPAEFAQINVRTTLGVIETAIAASDGTYTVGQLTTDTYKVEFVPPPGSLDLLEFYDDQPDEASATPVVVTAGADTPGIDADLDPDTIPPVVTIDSGPSGPTQQSTPTFTFSTEAGVTLECSIDTGTASYGPCSGDPTSHTASSTLADGPYTFRVRAMDPTGNIGEAAQDFTVDTQPPSVTITGGPTGPTGLTTPTFTFSSPYDEYEESAPGFDCAIDPAGDPTPDYGVCTTSASHTAAPLADGDYVFRVRATDAATNSAVAQRAFSIDSDGPNISITSGASGPTNDATPSFGFNASHGTLECAIDPPAAPVPSYGPCSDAASHTPSSLADGDYVFRVRATDDVLNSNTDQRSFTIDTVAPAVSVTGGPSGATGDNTPSFDFTTDGSAVQCAIDPAGDPSPDYGACTDGNGHDASTLADGDYVFRVQAADAAGNSATDQRSFTVDTGITLTIVSGPSGPTNDATPTFGFNAEAGASVECSIDTGTASYGPCSSGSDHTPAALANGSYTFRVRATDAATNSIVDTRGFSVDTVAPTVSITSGPSGETTNPTPTFTFDAEAGAAVQCSLDTGSAAFGPCSSGSSHTPSAPLVDGAYVFRVRASDSASNAATATRSFELDAPTAPPPPPDTTPPTIEITDGPKGKTKDKTPTFEFHSNDTFATFSCKVDKGAAFTCDSPATLKKQKPGKHTFSVTATDRSGNQSAPASQAFTVKKKKKKKGK